MSRPRRSRVLIVATWSIALALCGGYIGLRITAGAAFESNILGMIPNINSSASEWQYSPSSELQTSFVVLISHPAPSHAAEIAKQLHDSLAHLPGISVNQGITGSIERLSQFFSPYRHQVLTPQQRQDLQQQDAITLAQTALDELYSPVRPFRPYTLTDDPFNLGGPRLLALFPQSSRVSTGAIPTLHGDAGDWYLVHGKTLSSPFELGTQKHIKQAIDAFKTRNPEAQLLLSGLVFHASEASNIARAEISTVGVGSLLGIVCLVVAVFRSRAALLAICYTLLCSLVIALATSLAVFGKIHLITLAFGSTLTGLAVDYCFHFLIKYRRHRDSLLAGRLIFRGILLSAASSILAYLVQLYSPFPGLQQIAIFVASGLIGACVAVATLALCYRDDEGQFGIDHKRLFSRVFMPMYRLASSSRMLLITILVLALSLLSMQLAKTSYRDDIRLLNTSSAALLRSEQEVQKLLGSIDTQRYWLVESKDPQQLLTLTEQVTRTLQSHLPVVSQTQVMPSLAQQQRDYRLIADKLYGPDGALQEFCRLLANDCTTWDSLPPPFQDGLQPGYIPVDIRQYFPALLIGDETHSLIFPSSSATDAVRRTASIDTEGAVYIDQVQKISDTLTLFRVEISKLFALFLLLFSIICLLLYRARALLILPSALISVFAGLALSTAEGITLFHILALLLVMGIAVDTAIFYVELGLNADTWLASSMSTLTSILAFGLLSLSRVPLLHHFGSVVFCGLLCAWFITPVLYLSAERWFRTHEDAMHDQ